ncbi:hypothetical protein LMG22037_00756 [Paraburkholderia phenoliruptrix]|uniref:Uncharacterized protein n=1 Tax=Paraburkholderia phenoliruptrix TaxID=252970 RepID=A0A6J4ZYM5_9BURK|nr:hypothetical protein LMG22037_00756 [Paraburkholderia phenoliruptrix]
MPDNPRWRRPVPRFSQRSYKLNIISEEANVPSTKLIVMSNQRMPSILLKND